MTAVALAEDVARRQRWRCSQEAQGGPPSTSTSLKPDLKDFSLAAWRAMSAVSLTHSTPARLQNPLGMIQDIHQANVTGLKNVGSGMSGAVKGVGSGILGGLDKMNPLHLGKK